MRYRLEQFGGIVSADDPPFLAFVDRQYMREMGMTGDAVWQGDPDAARALSAPVEVHFACTNRCSLGCTHCYMNSGAEESRVLDKAHFTAALDVLADMGVFHVALGGGEALERDDLFELAAHARDRGLVPNLTTNGHLISPALAEKMRVFGQVNLSLDGVGAAARTFRNGANFEDVDRAFDLLKKAGVSSGINCVVGCNNFDALDQLFEYAVAKEISEIELLRFKPSGRGAALYAQHATNREQNRTLYLKFQQLAEQTGIRTKIDCSFIPMLCYHRPPPEILEAFCVCGCEAGNFLLGARSDGRICGCSFLPSLDLTIEQLSKKWNTDLALQRYRTWSHMRTEPCASCEYLRFCKGGCHAVAGHVTGDLDAPDPGCPWVAESAALSQKKERA